MARYQTVIVTPPNTEPIAVSDVKSWLRSNTTDEDSIIPGMITTARMRFEFLTQRPVYTQSLRQYVFEVERGITLMRGNIQSISDVKYYDNNDSLQTDDTFLSNIIGPAPRVWWTTPPAISVNVKPPVYVDYVAGWTSTGAIPADVKMGITLLAAHYFSNREAYIDGKLNELPEGFRALCAQYAMGLEGEIDDGNDRRRDYWHLF